MSPIFNVNPMLPFTRYRSLRKWSSPVSHSFLISEKGIIPFTWKVVPTK